MKSMARQSTRWLLLVVLAFSLIVGSGCGPKPISRETLDYFYGLVNKQYWQLQTNGLALNDEFGTEQLILAQQGTSDKEQYIVFGDVAVTSSSQKSGPTDAVIRVKVFDGTTEKEVRARVDDVNRATLEKVLAETFESQAQRDLRLKNEAYAAKLKEADALLAANKVADAITAFKAARAINDTDEVKTRLDGIYLKQGKYYYGQKRYDVALAQLKLVSFDPASLKEAQELLPTVQADADKAAAAAKAAADKAAADKAAADKKASADKAAAEKTASQRRAWFYALDGYFWDVMKLDEDMGNTSAKSSSGIPLLNRSYRLYTEIQAYCDGHVGMKPTELDGMRKQVATFALQIWVCCWWKYTWDSLGQEYGRDYVKALNAQKEYLRLRAIVVRMYNY